MGTYQTVRHPNEKCHCRSVGWHLAATLLFSLKQRLSLSLTSRSRLRLVTLCYVQVLLHPCQISIKMMTQILTTTKTNLTFKKTIKPTQTQANSFKAKIKFHNLNPKLIDQEITILNLKTNLMLNLLPIKIKQPKQTNQRIRMFLKNKESNYFSI